MSDEARFLAAAEQIGCRLCRDAIWSGGCCNWLGWAMETQGGRWVSAFRAMGGNLYDGTAGIGLFLARLAPLTGDPIIRATAEAAFAHSLGVIDSLAASDEYGFYSGLAGIAWACREGGRLLARDALSTRGEAALRLAARIAPRQHRVDIINGSAGLILILIEGAEKSEELLCAAIRHGEFLLTCAERNGTGWSWDTLGIPNEPNLLGLAHGTSGIACALAQLADAAGREDFRLGAREAVRYERSHFREREGNWPDLRSFSRSQGGAEAPCMIAWCHGAAGIGMARLMLSRLLGDDAEILREAAIAVRTTAATLTPGRMQGIGDFSLCHGVGGNAELLLLAADFLHRDDLRRDAKVVGIDAIERYGYGPWPCGVPGPGETPNLLLGLAGIGYFFLRLSNPRATPTVLLPGRQNVEVEEPPTVD